MKFLPRMNPGILAGGGIIPLPTDKAERENKHCWHFQQHGNTITSEFVPTGGNA
jgi:hypothetical protein